MQLISSRRNAAASHVRKLGTDRAYRYEQGEFLCDGIRLLREAVSSNCVVTAVFTVSEKRASELATEITAPVYVAARDILDHISPLKTAQDVLFSCKMPCRREISPGARNIVLDGIQDPGNIGTAVRGAAAFGIDSVILCGACADIYNPKTVRATMGSIFRQNVVSMNYAELSEYVSDGLALFGAAVGEGACDVREADLKNISIAVGSEGAGLSDEVKKLCRKLVTIPMEPGNESLNAGVAANILMWMMYEGGQNAGA